MYAHATRTNVVKANVVQNENVPGVRRGQLFMKVARYRIIHIRIIGYVKRRHAFRAILEMRGWKHFDPGVITVKHQSKNRQNYSRKIVHKKTHLLPCSFAPSNQVSSRNSVDAKFINRSENSGTDPDVID